MTSKHRQHRWNEAIDDADWPRMPSPDRQRGPEIPPTDPVTVKIERLQASSRRKRRENGPQQEGVPMLAETPPYYPLVLAAAELDESTDRLAARLGSQVLADNAGVRIISRDLLRQLIDDKAAADLAKAERTAHQAAEHKARMRELDAKYGRRNGGIPAQPNSSALADMMAVDQQ